MLKEVKGKFNEIFPNIPMVSTVNWVEKTATSKIKDATDTLFYNALVDYYYYAEIGFDLWEQFIQRLNARWDLNINKYKLLYEKNSDVPAMITSGGYSDIHSGSDTDVHNITDTRTPNLTTDSSNKGRNIELNSGNITETGTDKRENTGDIQTKYDSTLRHEVDNSITYSTGDEVRKVFENNSVLFEFISQFKILFMEVI